jgi:ubiquitin carboxyl-terminal hydrolase 8
MTEIGVSKFSSINSVTCYMNSILAILQQTPIFIDYILTEEFKEKLLNKVEPDKLKASILYQFYNLMKISHSHNNVNIIPTSLRKAITQKNEMWGMNLHQDSQEFLTFLLNEIEEEISEKVIFIGGRYHNTINNPVSTNMIQIMAQITWNKFNEKEYSIIKNLFGGLSSHTVTCQNCMNKSYNFDIFQILQLCISSKCLSLYDCMDELIKNEIIDEKNMILCSFCGHKNRSLKKTMLWKLPKILIIQFKRFKVNDYGIVSQKLSNMIEYPIELDLKNYIDINSPHINNKTYKLYGVNCHHSLGRINTINFGHYTSIVLNQYDNEWYRFDDDSKLIKLNTDDIITKDAYMLFYILND